MAQTYKDGEINGFETGELSKLADGLTTKFDSGEVDKAVIAKMPEIGDEVEINGIKFFVQDYKPDGKVVLEPKGKQ